jgi:hypothetical protein
MYYGSFCIIGKLIDKPVMLPVDELGIDDPITVFDMKPFYYSDTREGSERIGDLGIFHVAVARNEAHWSAAYMSEGTLVRVIASYPRGNDKQRMVGADSVEPILGSSNMESFSVMGFKADHTNLIFEDKEDLDCYVDASIGHYVMDEMTAEQFKAIAKAREDDWRDIR